MNCALFLLACACVLREDEHASSFWGPRQVALMGARGEFVVSGSDDGHVFVWDRASGRLANMLRAPGEAADAPVLCAAPHPLQPVLASAGQEHVVRLWAPLVSPLSPG